MGIEPKEKKDPQREANINPILHAKLSIPTARIKLLPRPHLIAQLAQSAHHKLTLLSAPAGSGKTLLLSAWSKQIDAPLAWLTLDESDNDPARFWNYLLTALAKLYPEPHISLSNSSYAPLAQTIPSILTLLINALAELQHDRFLILDDYHLVQDQTIHASLAFLLEHLPVHIHLVLASRSDPPLPLSRLRVSGELLELRSADLRCSPSEVASFLRDCAELHLSPNASELLARRTEGWWAGLQLAALSLQKMADDNQREQFVRTFSGQDRYILDYLLEEVLQHQPPSVQRFLLETSILTDLNGSLCSALCPWGNTQEILENVVRANLFLVPLDHERHWYRYHQLFAAALRHRLHLAQPEHVPQLHQRAANWLASHAMLVPAIEHALAAGNVAQASQLIIQVAETLLMRGEVSRMQQWLDGLPTSLVRAHPFLSVAYAFLLLMRTQLEDIEERLQDAERALAHEQSALALVESEALTPARLRGMIATVRSTVSVNLGDTEQAVNAAQYALEYLSPQDHALRGLILHNLGDTYKMRGETATAMQMLQKAVALNQDSGNLFVALTALCDVGKLQAIQGQLRQAADTYYRALELGALPAQQGGSSLLSAGKAQVYLSELLYEWNELDNALYYAQESVQRCKEWSHIRHLLEGYIVLAQVHYARTNIQAAHDTLNIALGLTDEIKAASQHLVTNRQDMRLLELIERVETLQAHFWLVEGEIERAELWLRERGFNLEIHPCLHPYAALALSRLLLLQKRPELAQRLLEPLIQETEAKGEILQLIDLLAWQALTLQQQGQLERALSAIARALALAEAEELVRTFVDKGHAMFVLLQRAAHQGIAPRYCQRLLLAFSLPGVQGETLVELSKRELEILQLLASGKTNREIGALLTLTTGTVKWYVHEIYNKLGVGNRTRAIAEARRLHILT
ncbi:hypothetical protein EPA93_06320 [Ktedonosporobacter rubrisoli]|uniref:HTH luxR-type domain-containing protein n=1 Tax=Ktedonosporobacter rubrisoli TaxID=2509675 RepID=A0A4P6JKF5_KTERU|nr:LuxR C-terminal-related transcriptional regulator [Ktedonosporobacter rubrisoli]QBD75639.1 hypothetical protein EPA93_06320 [Ktedonosporobacter rubrisoli]